MLEGTIDRRACNGHHVQVPRTDVSAAFREHAVTLNDLRVGLLEAELVKKRANAEVLAADAKNPPRDFARRKEQVPSYPSRTDQTLALVSHLAADD